MAAAGESPRARRAGAADWVAAAAIPISIRALVATSPLASAASAYDQGHPRSPLAILGLAAPRRVSVEFAPVANEAGRTWNCKC